MGLSSIVLAMSISMGCDQWMTMVDRLAGLKPDQRIAWVLYYKHTRTLGEYRDLLHALHFVQAMELEGREIRPMDSLAACSRVKSDDNRL